MPMTSTKRIPTKRTSLKRGAVCSICKHPERVRIEQSRCAGASLSAIASKFQISRDALHRHMHRHVPEDLRLQYLTFDVPVSELAARAADAGVSLLDYFSIVRGVLLQQFQMAAAVGDRNGTAVLAGRLTEVLREIGKLTGEILKSPMVQNINNSISIMNSPIFVDLQQMLIRRLAGHPEAMAAVVEGLRELETRSAPHQAPPLTIEHREPAHA
jgi:hypothetical protein